MSQASDHDKHGSSKVSLSFGLKKSKRKQPFTLTSNDGIAEVFGASRQPSAEKHLQHEQSTRSNHETPLVIPVAANKFSIQDSLAKSTNAQNDNGDDDYPDAPSFASESFARVPISQFGAAMLRGMGWKPQESKHSQDGNDESNALPRPHRLGLGAIPKLPDDVSCSSFYAPTHSKKPRRPDQVRQDAAKQTQLREFQLEQQRLQARDKQVTLQNGSIVYVSLHDNHDGNDAVLNMQKSKQTPRRAIMVKLVGVPGLNRVQVQCEGSRECIILQRRQVLGLVSRSELEKAPFLEPPPRATTVPTAMDGTIKQELLDDDERQRDGRRRDEETNRSKGQNNPPMCQDDQRHMQRRNDHDKNRPAKRIKSDLAKSGLHEQQQKQQHTSWIIPHIRVRVTTEKLGRKHYRQKGTVIDVTPKGATVRMDASKEQQQSLILDHVIEKHLETALPKVGGKVVIVAKSHAHYLAKGTLMERDARNSCGMIQLHQDLAVLTLSLDDLAEWCGPLDDDDE